MAKIINTAVKNSLHKNKSFALLRTNPKLTSNVKLVTDSNEDIYLSSIKASRTLSQSEFQKYPISDSGQYCRDVSQFYGRLSKDERYRLGREFTDLGVSSDYSTQYENLYNYGASFNFTKVYDEQCRIFAPIWLEESVPEKFVIYRVKDVDFKENIGEGVEGQNSRIQEMLSNATLIKTFDLTNNSKLGRYLNSHINDPLLPKSHIDFNFELDDPTYFNGIDVMLGGFIEKSDYIDDDYIKEDLPEILANNTLTTSFERNGIISHNVFNLEFLFDDNDANDYEIYRYFGLFVDVHEEGKVLVNSVNAHGYLNLDGSVDSDNLPSLTDITQPILGWVKDSNQNFHNILNRFRKTRLNGNQILTSYRGDSSLFVNKVKNPFNTPVISKEPFNGFIELDIIQSPSHNDKIFLGDLLEISIENFNLGDFILIADENLQIGTFEENRYSAQGNTSQIAAALAAAIRNAEVIPYKATSIKNKVIIDDYSQGRNKNTTVFGIHSSNPYIFINMQSSTDANEIFEKKYNEFISEGGTVTGGLSLGDYEIYTMIGGCAVSQGILISELEIGNVRIGDYVKEKNKDVFVKIIEIVKDPYSDNYRVIFDKPVNFSSDLDLISYTVYETPFGKFSAYDFKDFNFDFYDTSNSDTAALDLESLQYKNDDAKFSVSSAYSVSILAPNEGNTFSGPDWAIIISGGNFRDFIKKGDFLKSSIDGEYVQVKEVTWVADSYNVTRISLQGEPWSGYTILNGQVNEDSEIVYRPGDDSLNSFKFKSLTGVIADDGTENDVDSNVIQSEYDRLNENNLKETSINSRIIPTICKFSLKNSTNSRNLPYILNVNEAFGVNNLSSDISIFSDRDPQKLNMEHFYLLNIPSYLKNENSIPLIRDYVEVGNTKGTYEYLSDAFKDTSFDYFSYFMNYTGGFDSDENWVNAIPHQMYTIFGEGDSMNFSSSVFKGLRYVYKDRKEFELDEPISFTPSSSVNGYKMSTILCYHTPDEDANPAEEDINDDVKIEVIKNDKFKTISILINLRVSINDVKELDRYLLYTLEDLKRGDEVKNTKIRGFLEFGGTSSWGDGTSIAQIQLQSSAQSVGLDAPRFSQDIFKINEEYSYILFDAPGYGTHALEVVSVIDDSNIIVTDQAYKWTVEGIDKNQPLQQPSIIPNNTPLEYAGGGERGWNNILQDITSYGLSNRINSNREIEYVAVSELGEISNNDYVIHIEDGVEFIKTSILTVETDDDKPKAFKINNREIGYDLVAREDGGYYTTLKRMNGSYDPLFRDVIAFTSPYEKYKFIDTDLVSTWENTSRNQWARSEENAYHDYIRYNRFSGINCMFSSNLKLNDNYGFIKNFFFHKVNEEGGTVVKLSQETDKLPLYPLIGEIAIDKKDLNLFKSKYSNDYYTRSYGGSRSVPVSGTLSPIEERSFMASTIMKVKNEYNISSYDTIYVSSLTELDIIRYDEKENEGAYFFEDSQKIYIDFYVADSFIQELKEDKITSYYNRYVKPESSFGDKTTLEDDVNIYIRENIIPRFLIDSIKIYGKQIAGSSSELNSISDVEDISSGGYLELTNFEIRSFAEKPLDFRLIYNKKPGYSYKLRVHSKIIA
jgi:hypothetical protein